MSNGRLKHLFYGLLCFCGIACVAFAYQQQRYAQFLALGKRAVIESRFDSQHYARARRAWFANQDALLFNQGVLAHTAGNLQRATDYFRRVSHHAGSPALRTQALYNLGLVLLDLQEVRGAAELFKEALRLDPHDTEVKVVLERLYQVIQPHEETREAAADEQGRDRRQGGKEGLKQAPGLGQEPGQDSPGAGQGRSAPRPGI